MRYLKLPVLLLTYWLTFVSSAFADEVKSMGTKFVYTNPENYTSDKKYSCPAKSKLKDSKGATFGEPEVRYHCRPFFPKDCVETAQERQIFDVIYDVKPDGVPSNVRLLSSTNECLNATVIMSVFMSRYKKSAEGALAVNRQVVIDAADFGVVIYDEPVAINFKNIPKCGWLSRAPKVDDGANGPKLLSRCEPTYPSKCMPNSGGRTDVVTVLFDVNGEGGTENFRVTRTTNPCLNNSAAIAVANWKYDAAGETTSNLTTRFTYELE